MIVNPTLRHLQSMGSRVSLRSISSKPGLKSSKYSPSTDLLGDNGSEYGNRSSKWGTGSVYADMTKRLADRSLTPRKRDASSTSQLADETARLNEMLRTNRRTWQAGDIYAPHDLTSAEARKWKRRQAPTADIFDQLGLNPLKEWKNPAMMFEFQTAMGRIKARKETGLRPVNQRKIAKAIRRGIGMGFLPSVHAHPEILRRYPHYVR